MELTQKTLKILMRDQIRNMNLLNFISDYPIDSIHREGDSVLVKGRSDQDWVYISSQSEKELAVLRKYLTEKDQYFAIIEDWMLPWIVAERKIEWKLSCMKLYFPGDTELPENKISVQELSPSDAEYIYNNSKYQQYTSTAYILERMNKGVGFGIYKEDKLIAWVLTHDDGAIGFLHVLPEHRGKGYARELTIAMIKRLRKRGEVPFVHIEEDNQQSMNLSLAMGFKKDRLIHWLKIK